MKPVIFLVLILIVSSHSTHSSSFELRLFLLIIFGFGLLSIPKHFVHALYPSIKFLYGIFIHQLQGFFPTVNLMINLSGLKIDLIVLL